MSVLRVDGVQGGIHSDATGHVEPATVAATASPVASPHAHFHVAPSTQSDSAGSTANCSVSRQTSRSSVHSSVHSPLASPLSVSVPTSHPSTALPMAAAAGVATAAVPMGNPSPMVATAAASSSSSSLLYRRVGGTACGGATFLGAPPEGTHSAARALWGHPTVTVFQTTRAGLMPFRFTSPLTSPSPRLTSPLACAFLP